MARTTLRSSPLPTRVALAAALIVGLVGVGVSLHLAAQAHAGDFWEGLSPEATRLRVCAVPLERALETSMAPHVPSGADCATLLRFVRSGAPLAGFYEGPGRVLAARCGPCHGAQAGPQAGIRLETYGDALSLARPGGRDPYRRLGKLHVHLFAIGALLSLLALGLARTRFPPWFAGVVGLFPLGALVASVPLSLGACQTSWGPFAIWFLDALVVLGWVLGSGVLLWDLLAPVQSAGDKPADGG